jgi:hypothetical protein
LDKDGFEYHFGHGQCAIWCNNACVGIAYLHDELYLLSLREKVDSVCDVNVANDSRSESVQKKTKRTHDTSSKLWHYRLGHTSRGRIESLIKNEILAPLEFSHLEQCVDCVKGNYVK